jgi:carboxyvinyl-carboxyphosphonate phosphorylmutase
MTALTYRQNFRAALAKPACISPASVYDPLSARIAESVGYRIGMLAGSVASFSTLAAPDVIVMTLTEVADQVRRIMRASNLGLLIDADHGYGNALNAMRTIEELEHAGASAVSIEDTLLPQPFGAAGKETVVSLDEMVGKLLAALAARRDPDFVIAGRTSSVRAEGIDRAVERVKAYAATGVDAIFAVGVETLDQVQSLSAACRLPLILGPMKIDRSALAAEGVAIVLQGHQPIAAAAKALRDAYTHLHEGRDPQELNGKIASNQEMDQLVRTKEFNEFRNQYL